MAGEQARQRRVVIVGSGFAGFHAARTLSRLAKRLDLEVVLVNPADYFLYLPLLPEVAAGILDPSFGATAAAANPLGVPLSGLAARAVTCGYHLKAIPTNRVRGPAVPLGSAAGAGGGAASQAPTLIRHSQQPTRRSTR